jgi:4-hydroxy-3-polyprenylbenzoate decarboxylase
MIVALCSMRSRAAIRHGPTDTLLTRAADVTLKEGRRLVLLARETPLNETHLENMLALARMGVAIARLLQPAYLNR